MSKPVRLTAACWSAIAAILATGCAVTEANDIDTVVVDTRTVLEVNGYRDIQRQIFGLTAYEGPPQVAETPERAEFLKRWGIESLGMPAPFRWVLPRDVKSMDAEALDKWFADPKGAAWLFGSYPGRDRYVYGRLLPNIRTAGTEPWLYLLGGVPGSTTKHGVPTDYDLLARLALHYVRLARKADPKLTYVHLFNEPNAHWYRDGKGWKEYAEAFVAVATAVKAEFPDMKIGGPVTCWPLTWPPNQKDFPPWYGWGGYGKGVIDVAAKQLDFLDWHAYGVPARALEGELHIATGYAVTHHDKWLASAITETNFGLTKDQWISRSEHFRRRVVPMIRQTFAFLRHPDKIFCQQIHDLNAIAGRWYKFWGRGVEEVKVTPMQEFFAVCKPLRGTRLVTSVAEPLRPDVWVEAAYRNNRLTVAVVNFADEPRRIRLRLKGLPAGRIEKATGQVLDVESLREVRDNDLSGQLTLPAQSLRVWVLRLKDPLRPKRTLDRREFFAKTIMKPLPGKHPSVTVRFPLDAGVQTNAESAALRFGIKGKGPEQGRWQIELAGRRVVVDAPGAFVEVPLPIVPQGMPVEATITRLDDPAEDERPAFLSFASLVLTAKR